MSGGLRNATCAASGLAALAAGVAGSASLASSAGKRITVHARLSQGADPPLLRLQGVQDGRKRDRYAIQGSLRGLPCPGRISRLVLATSVGPPGSSYDATFALRRAGGDRVRCGVRLPRQLGLTVARLQIYGTGATPADSVIVVSARRTGAAKIAGTFTAHDLPCDRAYKMRIQLSAPSGRVSMVYGVTMRKVSINGRRCT